MTSSSVPSSSFFRTPRGVLGLFGFSVAALLACCLPLPIAAQVPIWVAAILIGVLLSRKALLWLVGPVFASDLTRTLRRSQLSTLRAAYASLLLLVLFGVYLSWFRLGPVEGLARIMEEQTISANEQARFAREFSMTFLIAQFVVLIGLTPAFAAGSLAEEKEKKTYDDLMLTDLTPREIIVGKLVSRVAHLFLLLLAGLPVVASLQLLGGVDPAMLLACFVITFLSIISTASACVYWSLWASQSRTAVTTAYFGVGVSQLVFAVFGLASGQIFMGDPEFAILNIFASLSMTGASLTLEDLSAAGMLGGLLPALLLQFLMVHALLTAFFVYCSILEFPDDYWRKLKGRKPMWEEPRRQPSEKVLPPQHPREPRLRLPLREDAPVLWKDLDAETGVLRRTGHHYNAMTLVPALVAEGICLELVLMGLLGGFEKISRVLAETVVIMVPLAACSALLLLALRSAGTISREREAQTLDVLLTTALTREEILEQKWQACGSGLKGLVLLLALLAVNGVFHNPLVLLTVPLFAAGFLAQACFTITLGMYCSQINSSTYRATIFTICGLLGVALGHWLIFLVVSVVFQGVGHGDWIEGLSDFHAYGLTPPLNQITLATFGEGREAAPQRLLAACAGSLLYGALALGLWWRLKRRFGIDSGRMG